jgi:lipoprotein-releasing system permease protein
VLKLFLWLRYLRKKKIVFLCIAAVTLSVALLIVVDSFFTGLIKGLEKSLAVESGDLIIYTYQKPIPRYQLLIDKLQQIKSVRAAAPVCWEGGLLWLDTGDVREVAVKGVDIEREAKFTDWQKSLLRQKDSAESLSFNVPSQPDANGAWVGVNILAEPNEKTDSYDLQQLGNLIGKKIVLTMEGADRKRRVLSLRISDIVFTDTFWGDQTVFLPFEQLYKIQRGVQADGYATFIKLSLQKNADKNTTRQAIVSVWEQFARGQLGWDNDDIARLNIVEEEQQTAYFNELQKQMAVLLLIFGVICSVVILLVFCIFYMIVETRLKDIAIIKSCGASATTAASVFIGFGGCVGLAGSGFGIVLGYIIIKNVNILERWVHIITGIKLWRRSAYILNYIPNQIDWSAVLPIVLIAVLGCCLGAALPSIVAAKTKPVDILRYE